MKYLFNYLILFLVCNNINAQDMKYDDYGKMYYESVTKIDSVNAPDLYQRARAFMALTFKSANSVIQMDDKEAGIIIGKGNYDGIVSGIGKPQVYGPVNFTVTINIKDGRYKLTITDFYNDYAAMKGYIPFGSFDFVDCKHKALVNYKKYYDEIRSKIPEFCNNFRTSLFQAMKSPAKKDDW